FERAVYNRPDDDPFAEIIYPLFLRKFSADIYHMPMNVVPYWMPKPYLVTAHDISSVLFAPGHGLRGNLHAYRFLRGGLNAGCGLTVANATRRAFETVLGVSPARIRTVYNAPDRMFGEPAFPAVVCLEDGSQRYPPEMQRILDRYQIDYPFLLYVGRTN